MDETISRSEQKRRFKRIEDVAQELAELTDKDLKKFPGDKVICEEIKTIRGLSGGARKRQVKHLSKILRQGLELDAVYDFLSKRKGSHLKEKTQLHEAEHLRDALINEAMEDFQYCRSMQIDWEPDWKSVLLGPAVAKYERLDEDALRKTVYQYVKSHNRLYYRELFRIIKAAIDHYEMCRRVSAAAENI
jgi:ribosome-associated protein